jgi:hypothetical protein
MGDEERITGVAPESLLAAQGIDFCWRVRINQTAYFVFLKQ